MVMFAFLKFEFTYTAFVSALSECRVLYNFAIYLKKHQLHWLDQMFDSINITGY